jgi:hypothetical protein
MALFDGTRSATRRNPQPIYKHAAEKNKHEKASDINRSWNKKNGEQHDAIPRPN